MLIVYGTRVQELGSHPIGHGKCPEFGSDELHAHFIQKWFHIYYMPIIPVGKVSVLQCHQCTFFAEGKDIDPELKLSVDSHRGRFSTPFWTFTGAALFVGFITIGALATGQEKGIKKELLANPELGDMYVSKINEMREGYYYDVMRIQELTPDAVVFLVGEYMYSVAEGGKKAIHG